MNIPTGKMKDLLPEIFHWNDPKVLFRLFFNRILRKRFVSGRQPKNENNRDYLSDLAVVVIYDISCTYECGSLDMYVLTFSFATQPRRQGNWP